MAVSKVFMNPVIASGTGASPIAQLAYGAPSVNPNAQDANQASAFEAGPSAPPALPSWYPQNWDLQMAASAVPELLGKEQGALHAGEIAPPRDPSPKDVVFSDWDLTMANTHTPVLLRYTDGPKKGELVYRPDGKLMTEETGSIRENVPAELAELKAKFPDYPWDQIAPDYAEFASIDSAIQSPPTRDSSGCEQTLDSFKSVNRDSSRQAYVVTARGAGNTSDMMAAWLHQRGATADGVLGVNNPDVAGPLGFTSEMKLNTAQKKALTMAAVMASVDPAHTVKTASFIDNTDDNLKAAMHLLPALYPDVTWTFKDNLHKGDSSYQNVEVARWDANAKEMKDAKTSVPFNIDEYQSVDAPWTPEPGYQ